MAGGRDYRFDSVQIRASKIYSENELKPGEEMTSAVTVPLLLALK